MLILFLRIVLIGCMLCNGKYYTISGENKQKDGSLRNGADWWRRVGEGVSMVLYVRRGMSCPG